MSWHHVPNFGTLTQRTCVPTTCPNPGFFPTLPCGVFRFSCSIPPAASSSSAATSSTSHHQQHPLTINNIISPSTTSSHHQHIIINTTHHQHTTPSPQHHEHIIITTHHHQHNILNITPSTQHQPKIMNTTSGSFCMAGAALGAPAIEVRGSLATSDDFGRRLVLRGMRSTWSTSGSFCVAGAALGAPQDRFAWQGQHSEHLSYGSPATSDDFGRRLVFSWQAQHLEHLRLVLHGRRSTWSTFIDIRGSPLRVMTLGATSFCAAGAALGAPPARFAWQSQHLECLHRCPRKSGNKARRFVLRGTRST